MIACARPLGVLGFLAVCSACEIPVGITSGESKFEPQYPTKRLAFVGFPADKADCSKRDYEGACDTFLQPGDSLRLYIIWADHWVESVDEMRDTLRSATVRMDPYTWGPSFGPDSSLATLTRGTDGALLIHIHKPSYRLTLRVNGNSAPSSAWTCHSSKCDQVNLTVPQP